MDLDEMFGSFGGAAATKVDKVGVKRQRKDAVASSDSEEE